ncbi:hypothetical protein RKD23_003023 [Streptomyces sp. SAI-170]
MDGRPSTFHHNRAPFGPFSSLLLVSTARFAMSHIFISLDRSCTVVGTVSAQNGYKGSRNGRFLPPSRTERRPMGLAAPGCLSRSGQLALLSSRGRAGGGPERSRELGQGGLHEVPGPRAVRGTRTRGARTVRRLGRVDRGRARRTHGPGAAPSGDGFGLRRRRRFEQLKERFFRDLSPETKGPSPGTPGLSRDIGARVRVPLSTCSASSACSTCGPPRSPADPTWPSRPGPGPGRAA